jgi:hypothetical protein
MNHLSPCSIQAPVSLTIRLLFINYIYTGIPCIDIPSTSITCNCQNECTRSYEFLYTVSVVAIIFTLTLFLTTKANLTLSISIRVTTVQAAHLE